MASTPRTPYQAAARELLRTTLLESARTQLRDRRWPAITMADIAAGASVSRQTLYNEFGTRAEFVQAYLLYDADRILTAVEHAIDSAGGDPKTTLRVAFREFLDTIADDPLAIEVLSGDDDDGLLALVTTRGGPVVEVAAMRLGGAISRVWPDARGDDVKIFAEHLVRLAISHAALPGPDAERTANDVAAVLAPFAEMALQRGAERTDVPAVEPGRAADDLSVGASRAA